MAVISDLVDQQLVEQVKLDRFYGKTVFPDVYVSLSDSLEREIDALIDELKARPIMSIENLLEELPDECEIEEGSCVGGVDAGSNGSELEGFYFGAVTGIAYLPQTFTKNGKTVILPVSKPLSRGSTFRCNDCERPRRHLSLVEFAFLYSTALEAVIRTNPSVLFVDGGLLLNSFFIPSKEETKNQEVSLSDFDLDLAEQILIGKKRHYFADFVCTVYFVLELLRECSRRKTTLIGIIKRPRGYSFFNDYFSDSSVLERAGMQVGTKSKTKFVGIQPMSLKYDETWQEFYSSNADPKFCDKHEGYLKEYYLKTVPNHEPIRVQVPYWVNDKASAALTFAFADSYEGVPIQILKADSLTCVSDQLLGDLHARLSLKLHVRTQLDSLNPLQAGIARPKR